MAIAPDAPRRSKAKPAPAGESPATVSLRQSITVMDCTIGIKRRRTELIILLLAGVVIAALPGVLALMPDSGVASEPALTKAARAALTAPCLLPLKLSFDRYSELSLLKGVRETLEKGSGLSEFMLAELTKITDKKRKSAT